ncbi:hypothetical protein ACIBCU_19170 [Streptomyces sp. NPDC051064]|uniref:hypothetical protein n=1 Tax=Streptomyces sp. NPDC051064 TaxID=3365641 RepID=UPI00378B4CEE
MAGVTHELRRVARGTRPIVPAASVINPSPFTMLFNSTRRGARLARRMAKHLLDAWRVVTELCADAVQHGRVSAGAAVLSGPD